MSKTPIYFMPGLAAGPEIFYKLELDERLFEFHYLTWLKPLSIEETLTNYAMRMCQEIKHKKPVLIGVSFGGIVVQEMSKFIETEKVIIISSVKSNKEFPKKVKFAKKSKIYKLFPTQFVSNFDDYAKFFVGKKLERKAKMYQKYLSVRDKTYLKWAIHNVIHWQQEEESKNVIHIHGTKDHIFPIKYIKNCIQIENGTHAMILIKASIISKIIHESLTC